MLLCSTLLIGCDRSAGRKFGSLLSSNQFTRLMGERERVALLHYPEIFIRQSHRSTEPDGKTQQHCLRGILPLFEFWRHILSLREYPIFRRWRRRSPSSPPQRMPPSAAAPRPARAAGSGAAATPDGLHCCCLSRNRMSLNFPPLPPLRDLSASACRCSSRPRRGSASRMPGRPASRLGGTWRG